MITLQEFFQKCKVLPGRLQNHESKEGFIDEFKQVFNSQEAKDAFSVLYIFVCEEKIPRVKGKSSVVYIGKTEQTLKQRWLRYAKAFTSDFNSPFFSYVVAHYGEIRIVYLHFETKQKLKQAETDLLQDYYELYKEFPPHNAQRK
jgi:hypothetical protein